MPLADGSRSLKFMAWNTREKAGDDWDDGSDPAARGAERPPSRRGGYGRSAPPPPVNPEYAPAYAQPRQQAATYQVMYPRAAPADDGRLARLESVVAGHEQSIQAFTAQIASIEGTLSSLATIFNRGQPSAPRADSDDGAYGSASLVFASASGGMPH